MFGSNKPAYNKPKPGRPMKPTGGPMPTFPMKPGNYMGKPGKPMKPTDGPSVNQQSLDAIKRRLQG